MIDVVEITDPGCIWSWGSVDKIAKLRAFPGLRWRRILGVPGPRPGGPEEQHANWLQVSVVTGARVAERLEYVASSSLPESLAARAAERQGHGDAALQRLREATFLEGRPADSVPRIREALASVDGLDLERLVRDMNGPSITASVLTDRAETRRPPLDLIASGVARADGDDFRYPFPTLIIDGRVFPGWTPYEDYVAAVAPQAVTT
jgi:protein-disulfide isomerase-like protein with CxxC motif